MTSKLSLKPTQGFEVSSTITVRDKPTRTHPVRRTARQLFTSEHCTDRLEPRVTDGRTDFVFGWFLLSELAALD